MSPLDPNGGRDTNVTRTLVTDEVSYQIGPLFCKTVTGRYTAVKIHLQFLILKVIYLYNHITMLES